MATSPSDYTVIVSQPPHVDLACFAEWLRGVSAMDLLISDEFRGREGAEMTGTRDAVIEYINNQYRLFGLLDRYLQRPTGEDGRINIFAEQLLIPLTPATRSKLLELYYEFDGPVMRELLVRRMKIRRDLEDVAEELKINAHSCRRQYMNLKRISKAVDEVDGSGLVGTIQTLFQLPLALAGKYARIHFLSSNRIEVFKNRKRLAAMTFEEIDYYASMMLDNWTMPPTLYGKSPAKADLDAAFLRDISDVKTAVLGANEVIDDLRRLMGVYFTAHDETILHKGKGNMRHFVRTILTLGAGLRLEREFRDILVDIDEKVVDPARKINWTSKDIQTFLDGVLHAFARLEAVEAPTRDRLLPSFERFIVVVRAISTHMYQFGAAAP